MITNNQRTVKLNLQRIDICDLLIACTMVADASQADKWTKLYDKLQNILEAFDESNGIK